MSLNELPASPETTVSPEAPTAVTWLVEGRPTARSANELGATQSHVLPPSVVRTRRSPLGVTPAQTSGDAQATRARPGMSAGRPCSAHVLPPSPERSAAPAKPTA